MKLIAVPLANRRFTPHFGAADEFALFTVADDDRAVAAASIVAAPAHERGAYPKWLRAQGVTTILAGGMGMRATQMLAGYGIEVVAGVEDADPRTLVQSYLEGTLVSQPGVCGGGLHRCDDHDR
jgi:predicted Fe-Mo cluster-binding NifX family protein